jgi:small-conductance mechanosensitive channel
MHIEFLWVIPIISLAVFFFIVAYQFQKSADRRSKTSILSKEVALFNAGQEIPTHVNAQRTDDRLAELEKAINLVAEVLARQQQSAPAESETAAADASAHSAAVDEINELKEKLRTVFREYDIILSENYSLRARVKQLSKQVKEPEETTEPAESRVDSILSGTSDEQKSSMAVYDDTRLINLARADAGDSSELFESKTDQTPSTL